MIQQFMDIFHPAWEGLLDFVLEYLSDIGILAPIVAIPIVFAIFAGAIWLLRIVHKIEVLNVGTDLLLWPTIIAAVAFIIIGACHPEGIWEIGAVALFAVAFIVAMIYSYRHVFGLEMRLWGKLLLMLDAAAFVFLTFLLSIAAISAGIVLLMILLAVWVLLYIINAKANPRRARLSNGTVVTEYEAGRWSGNDGHTYSDNDGGTFTQQD